MNINDRHTEIIAILQRTPYVTVEYLAEELHISPSSIRRDLTIMEARGLVRRTHGGVSLTVTDNLYIPFPLRMKAAISEKRTIASKALELVQEGDVIFLDSSSTCMFLAKELVKKRGITIISNNLSALHYLMDFSVKTVCTGGALNPENRNSMVGDDALRLLDTVRANIAFIAPQSIDKNGDLFSCYREGVSIVQHMLANAEQKIGLCDSTKLGKMSTYKQCSIGDLDALIGEISLAPYFADKFPHVKYY